MKASEVVTSQIELAGWGTGSEHTPPGHTETSLANFLYVPHLTGRKHLEGNENKCLAHHAHVPTIHRHPSQGNHKHQPLE